MFDIINLLIGVTFLVFIASVVVIAVGSICYLTAYIKGESGWVWCLCTVIGFGGIAFLTLGVPLWGPFIPGTTTGTVLGLFGWTNLMFVFGTMTLFHHEIGQWAKKRMRNKAMRRHPSYK